MSSGIMRPKIKIKNLVIINLSAEKQQQKLKKKTQQNKKIKIDAA